VDITEVVGPAAEHVLAAEDDPAVEDGPAAEGILVAEGTAAADLDNHRARNRQPTHFNKQHQ
jgi:hypothetical protein